MKNNLVKTTLFTLVAAALVALPAIGRAADATNPPAAQTPAPKKHSTLPFHGKVASVDPAAMTFTVGKLTVAVTSDTKITKDGKPATFSDIAVGDVVGGSYKKDAAGKLNAATVRVGEKKKKEAPPAK